jgi:molybdate transport system substrate-binding protein
VLNAILSLVLSGCPSVPAPVEVTVYAAASLRDAMKAIAVEYEKDGKAKVVFNFGSSGDLSRQIVAAGKADLFFSADEKEMDKIAAEGLLEAGSRRNLLSNQLVVIEPLDPQHPEVSIFRKPFQVEAMAGPALKRLSLGDPATVPVGRYAKAWLEKKGVWDRVKDRVLPAADVRASLAAVESAGAEAGIVYRTDAAISKRVRVVHDVPLDEGPRIVYVLGVLGKRPNAAEVRRFADDLASDPARKVFEGFGFLVPKEK